MDQRGVSLPELVIGLAVISMVLVIGSVAAIPRLAREAMRSTAHEARTLIQLARMEAIDRSHDCLFLVDVHGREMSVIDTLGTGTTTDDVVLTSRRMPSTVSVARPDAGSPITFLVMPGSDYAVVFDSAGHVSAGSGEMVLYGGEGYGKVRVFGAGGVRFEHWDGSSWVEGF